MLTDAEKQQDQGAQRALWDKVMARCRVNVHPRELGADDQELQKFLLDAIPDGSAFPHMACASWFRWHIGPAKG